MTGHPWLRPQQPQSSAKPLPARRSRASAGQAYAQIDALPSSETQLDPFAPHAEAADATHDTELQASQQNGTTWSPPALALPDVDIYEERVKREVGVIDALRVPYDTAHLALTGEYRLAGPDGTVCTGNMITTRHGWRFIPELAAAGIAGMDLDRETLERVIRASVSADRIDQAYASEARRAYERDCIEAQRTAYTWTGPLYDPTRSDREMIAIIKALVREIRPEIPARVTARTAHRYRKQYCVWVPRDFRGVFALQEAIDKRVAPYNQGFPRDVYDDVGYCQGTEIDVDVMESRS